MTRVLSQDYGPEERRRRCLGLAALTFLFRSTIITTWVPDRHRLIGYNGLGIQRRRRQRQHFESQKPKVFTGTGHFHTTEADRADDRMPYGA